MEENGDYTTGEIRHHHRFYIPSGDIIIQVDKAMFKIHSHFLSTQSQVFSDMFAAPRVESGDDGTESSPLVLLDDPVKGWELLLSAIYPSNPIIRVKYNGKESIDVLRITHKYCMDVIEEVLLSELQTGTDTAAYLDLMLASRVVDSSVLHDKALQGLITSEPKPTLEEARLIGVEAYHAIMSGSSKGGTRCRHCNLSGYLRCNNCGFNQ